MGEPSKTEAVLQRTRNTMKEYFFHVTRKKAFNTSHSLLIHKKDAHLGTTVKCDICQSEFSSNRAMRRHKVTEHEKISFSCISCGNSFKRKDILKKHYNRCIEKVANIDLKSNEDQMNKMEENTAVEIEVNIGKAASTAEFSDTYLQEQIPSIFSLPESIL